MNVLFWKPILVTVLGASVALTVPVIVPGAARTYHAIPSRQRSAPAGAAALVQPEVQAVPGGSPVQRTNFSSGRGHALSGRDDLQASAAGSALGTTARCRSGDGCIDYVGHSARRRPQSVHAPPLYSG